MNSKWERVVGVLSTIVFTIGGLSLVAAAFVPKDRTDLAMVCALIALFTYPAWLVLNAGANALFTAFTSTGMAKERLSKRSTGTKRLACASLLAGPFWFLLSRVGREEISLRIESPSVLASIFIISALAWIAAHLAGWVIKGFKDEAT
ncbi:hypothetical protein A6U87_14695 [Rhizobium sp. AC44/96]|uniref:hypothetical protein n=1 Tax=Rhizobium sp. AC44/96 TaxID=1841654 RepID=UPI00080FC215|nr:hypothetical protein [Rhizobium sp. AC44/96]OCJ05254.1 hypothetical protein A6U87_14695 [Rhizobium sp. AC44/96]